MSKYPALLGVIACAGWALRIVPLLSAGGPLAFPIDYDEGVYFASAALVARGQLPFRDFVYAHPGGHLLLLLPLAGPGAAIAGLASAFAAARVVATLIGLGNIIAIGALARRWWGQTAGIVAAALYATFPEVVAVERGAFLEPALNALVLVFALAWFRRDRPMDDDHVAMSARPPEARWDRLAGAALGAACAVKAWGMFSVAAALVSMTRQGWSRLGRLVGAATVAVTVMVVPFIVMAPSGFVDQVLGFQLRRPMDGVGRADRLRFIFEVVALRNRATLFSDSHVVSSTAALAGLVVALVTIARRRRNTAPERFVVALYLVMLASFLTGPSFFTQYDAHLALPEVLLASCAASVLWQVVGTRRLLRSAVAGGIGLALVLPLRTSVLLDRQHDRGVGDLAAVIRNDVPLGDCLFSFEPAWLLAAGRLPPSARVPLMPDTYAAMLLEATAGGRRFVDAPHAFADSASQREIDVVLRRCDWIVLGGRGPAQLSPTSAAYLQAEFVRHFPPEGATGIDIWVRRVRRRGVEVEG